MHISLYNYLCLCRLPTAEHINTFDVFFYGEDDMILTYPLLTAWWKETIRLQKLTSGKKLKDIERCGLKYYCNYAIGFVR